MIVILTEKPSAARKFAQAFGGNEGRIGSEQYRIVHASGHLYGFPKDISSLVDQSKKSFYAKWDLENLPWDPDDIKWRIEKIPGDYPAKCIKEIKNAFALATEVCIGTDNDPSGEGDLLGWEILIALGWKGTTSRMRFEDESEKSLRKAFEERTYIESPAKSGEFIKANARTKFDYISMQLTRMSSLIAKERGHRVLIRQGRLKSVMTYLIGHQLDLIKSYKKVPFYEARYKDENGNVYKRKESEDIRFPKAEDVDMTGLGPSKVIVDSTEKKTSPPSTLLDLAGLGTILGEKGYNTEQVLSVYQSMYEDDIVSYPRTEDKQMTLEQFEELKANAPSIAKVVGISLSLLTHLSPRKKHLTKDAAHGPNRPGSKIPANLDEIRGKYGAIGEEIYRTLALNSLAIFAEDYVYEHQTGHIEGHPEFIGTVNLPVSPGYKLIFNDDEEEETKAKPLGTRAESFIHEGANPKPKTPTMKWLIGKGGQLEKYKVGTGATRLSTFNDVKNGKDKEKQLVKMSKNGALSLTPTGELSFILLNGTYIASPKVTERLFENMEAVGNFEKDPKDIIESIKILAAHDFEVMKQNAANLPQGTDITAPKEKASGVFIPTGETIEFNREWGGHRFSDTEIERLLSGETVPIEAVSKTGEKYTARGSLQKGSYKKHVFWGFQRENSLPDAWYGHTFTEEEKTELLAGRSITGDDFKSKKGKTFACTLYYSDGKLTPEFLQKLPDKWCGHAFTAEEKEKLENGGKVIASDFVSRKTGKTFTAELSYVNGEIKAVFA